MPRSSRSLPSGHAEERMQRCGCTSLSLMKPSCLRLSQAARQAPKTQKNAFFSD